MTWAQRLKRVFSVDIEVCGRCGGSLKVIACIEDQDIIDRILAHLREKEQEAPARPLLVPPTRAPPATLSLFAGSESQRRISKDATEKTMAWTTAGSRSGMGGYELHDQLSEQFFRPAGGYFANFSSSVGSISEEIYSQQAVYFSYTLPW